MSKTAHALVGFQRSLWLAATLLIASAAAFLVYVDAEKRIDAANERRHESLLLADELRQSSDDLTRMVRTYVVTGDPQYKARFQEILDIRDGRQPRPLHYNRVYWDLVLHDDIRPRRNGEAISLLDLMRRAGYSNAEFDKLAEAKANSDALTQAEFTAMRLIEANTPTREVDRLAAIRLVNDDAYHQAKAGIMRPIDEFQAMVDTRTQALVGAAAREASLLRWVFIGFALAVMLSLFQAYRALRLTLGTDLATLDHVFARLAAGDFATPIEVPPGAQGSVLDNLARTQASLRQLDAERRRSTEELQAHRDELESTVAARTAEAHKARAEAELANSVKSRFLTNMSHEMRTPMHGILSFAQLGLTKTAEGAGSDKLQTYFERIKLSSERLMRLLNNLLDLSQLEARELELRKEAIDVISLASSAVAAQAESAAQRQIILVTGDIEPGLRVHCDSGKITQVLVNLLANAIRFSPRGTAVRIIATRDSLPDEHGRLQQAVTLSVIDTGPGIPASELQSIFELFEQGSHTRTDAGGTGLGLAICRQLVHLHGGRISAANNPEGGACFRLTLPAAGSG
jgi:signal transduction histidine kinase